MRPGRRRGWGGGGPAPRLSRRIYLRVARKDMALFKFILESYDNLAYLSVIDSRAALLQMVYGPDQESEVLEFLDGMSPMVSVVAAAGPDGLRNMTAEKQCR